MAVMARVGPDLVLETITIEMFGPVGTKIGPTGISRVTVIGPDSAEETREEVRCKESPSFRTRLAARLTIIHSIFILPYTWSTRSHF